MSLISDIKRQLDAALEAIETLDADRAAGRVDGAQHATMLAEREREAGRLLVALRRAQREARAGETAAGAPREERAPASSPTSTPWMRQPAVMIPVAVLLVVIGVGAGVLVGRTGSPSSTPVMATNVTPPTPGTTPSSVLSEGDVFAMKSVADRSDAPTDAILRYAHVALDQGKLDDARREYERVLAKDPKNVEAIDHIGAVLYKQGRVDEALAKVEEALRIEPTYIHALWDRTEYLFYGKEDFPGAVKAADAFLRVVPTGPDADTVKKLQAEARQHPQVGKR